MRLEFRPPREMLRALITAVGRCAAKGVAKARRPHRDAHRENGGAITSLLVKKTPFTAGRAGRVSQPGRRPTRTFVVSASPEIERAERERLPGLPGLGTPSGERVFVAAYPFDIAPTDDDRPFFFQLLVLVASLPRESRDLGHGPGHGVQPDPPALPRRPGLGRRASSLPLRWLTRERGILGVWSATASSSRASAWAIMAIEIGLPAAVRPASWATPTTPSPWSSPCSSSRAASDRGARPDRGRAPRRASLRGLRARARSCSPRSCSCPIPSDLVGWPFGLRVALVVVLVVLGRASSWGCSSPPASTG